MSSRTKKERQKKTQLSPRASGIDELHLDLDALPLERMKRMYDRLGRMSCPHCGNKLGLHPTTKETDYCATCDHVWTEEEQDIITERVLTAQASV